jgi:hypothetical protein
MCCLIFVFNDIDSDAYTTARVVVHFLNLDRLFLTISIIYTVPLMTTSDTDLIVGSEHRGGTWSELQDVSRRFQSASNWSVSCWIN